LFELHGIFAWALAAHGGAKYKMSLNYEELDFRKTPIGDLMLRRRRLIQLKGLDIYEVKLGEDFLMTSLFHEAESQLSKLGLGMLEKDNLDVVVGGLGLGYTAVSALEDPRLNSLVVVEYLRGVIEWHQNGLVPLGRTLTKDSRCRLVQADFFALCRNLSKHFDPVHPEKKHDAVLLDIDHTPTRVLNQTNTRFYTEQGLGELAQHLNPGGVFGLWADGFPQDSFTRRLGRVFETADAHTIRFDNPLTGGSSEGAVYLAQVGM
jgi:spermidine synthase